MKERQGDLDAGWLMKEVMERSVTRRLDTEGRVCMVTEEKTRPDGHTHCRKKGILILWINYCNLSRGLLPLMNLLNLAPPIAISSSPN